MGGTTCGVVNAQVFDVCLACFGTLFAGCRLFFFILLVQTSDVTSSNGHSSSKLGCQMLKDVEGVGLFGKESP